MGWPVLRLNSSKAYDIVLASVRRPSSSSGPTMTSAESLICWQIFLVIVSHSLWTLIGVISGLSGSQACSTSSFSLAARWLYFGTNFRWCCKNPLDLLYALDSGLLSATHGHFNIKVELW